MNSIISLQSPRGNVIIELSMALPILVLLAFGVADYGNALSANLEMSHLAREAGAAVSREAGVKGSAAWATNINSDLNSAISDATPVINLTGSGATGPSQFVIYYSLIEWNPSLSACNYSTDSSLGLNCRGPNLNGTLKSGDQDFYRIRKSNSGYAGTVVWKYGTLSSVSRLGLDAECACKTLPEVKSMTTKGLTLHSVEVFYDYRPRSMTQTVGIVTAMGIGISYRRTIFIGL